MGGTRVFVLDTSQGGCYIFRSKRCAIVESDSFSQVEQDPFPFLLEFPSFCQGGNQVSCWIRLDQGVVEAFGHLKRKGTGSFLWIQGI